MANVAFGSPIFSDVLPAYPASLYTPTFGAFGSWSASLPLTNMQNRNTAVARSSNALAASTKFQIDLGVARAVGVLALIGHNFSAAATVQWKGGTSAGASDIYNPGALALSFSAVSAEDRAGINFPAVLIPATTQTARHWECDIVDTANVDGYVEIARLMICGKYQPTTNMNYGASLGLEDDSTRAVTDGGSATYQEKFVRRTKKLILEHITESEAFANPWKMQRLLGTKGQLFFISDTADTTLLHERSFPCVMQKLDGLSYPYPLRNATAIELVEELYGL